MRKIFLLVICFLQFNLFAQNFITPYEKSNKKETTTYFECIDFYKKLDEKFSTIQVKTFGETDAGYPLHLVIYSNDGAFNPLQWKKDNRVVFFVNNGIHPGEPDGIDASMMLLRDIASNKIACPKNIVLAIIPVYNIGGCLNRNSFSRVNQDGPISYGFRGNAQNLDLNRDFIKCDSKEARMFAQIYHWLQQPEIFLDTHVSDGADYQHTITLLTTQHNKLGGETGKFLHDVFEPAIYKSMQEKKWDLLPYVNFFGANPDNGWDGFYDSPRYSSGFTTLFGTIGFTSETHMLKPFAQRVASTYDLMISLINESSKYASTIVKNKKQYLENIKQQKEFALSWKIDTSKFDYISFKGYKADKKISEVTGTERLFYDKSKPFEKQVKFYNYFKPNNFSVKPKAYIIPQGWYAVIDLLKINQVKMQQLKKDTTVFVEFYRIKEFKSSSRVYEKHYRLSGIKTVNHTDSMNFLKGDYIIYTNQPADRFLAEVLEPTADDSYFSWNFFDGILQQKEYYSEYRWEDVAASYLQSHPELKQQLEEKKKDDEKFAKSPEQQLDFVYRNSPWYEPTHLRYPVFRIK